MVKGVKFIDLRDAGDPVECAAAYDAAGADELCFLDISASHEGRGPMLDAVRRTAEACFLPLTVGGGVRSTDDLRQMLLAGADKVAINTTAVQDPAIIGEAASRFGSQCVVVAVDARRAGPGRWEIFTHGGRKATSLDAVGFAVDAVRRGAGEILLTSMDRDGTGEGFDIELTRAVSEAVSVPVIASGGVGTLAHLVEGVRGGRCERGACGVDLPFRDLFDRAVEGSAGRGRHSDADPDRRSVMSGESCWKERGRHPPAPSRAGCGAGPGAGIGPPPYTAA